MNRRLLLALAIVAITLLIAGTVWAVTRTSTTSPDASEQEQSEESALATPPAPPEPVEQEVSDIDRAQLETLAIEAATIMTTWDPTEDFNQTEAELRAADLMTVERADSIVLPERPTTGAEWNQAAQAEASSVSTVELNRATESDVVSVVATWVWVTDDGNVVSNSSERRVFYFDFVEDDGELRISDYSWESL